MANEAKYADQCVEEHGQCCPFCGHREFESSLDDWEEPELVEVNECAACRKSWKVGYAIAFVWVETE